MNYTSSIIKNKALRIFLPLFFSFLFIASIIVMIYSDFSDFSDLFVLISLLGLIISIYLVSKTYKWSFISFVIVIIGILFKREHWAWAGFLMTIGTFLLGGVSISFSFKIPHDFRNNAFLKWFGSMTGFIVMLFMTGLLFMNQHWSGLARAILIYSGCFLFFLTVLGMVFTLPFSNYVAWPEIDRNVLLGVVLIPMIFIFGFFILVFVFPDYYNSLMGRYINYAPWINADFKIQLFKLEGIPLY